ncbi:ribonuclease R [Mycoplasmopsis iners]|uniref:ribonuclease R n=1 Tax=Mycoplasmopsis iners TaxID=76630 RepID=UPI000690F525|nr:ribonuclease R [Mycoplasmopsis iners]
MLKEVEIYKLLIKNAPIEFVKLAKLARIKISENRLLTELLVNWSKNNKITEVKKGLYVPIQVVKEIEGTLKYASEGKFGFIDIEQLDENQPKESYFVPKPEFNGALPNDLVKATVIKYLDNTEKTFAKIDKIIERKTKLITGVYKKNGEYFDFIAISKNLQNVKFKILSSDVKIKVNDIVIAELLDYKKGIFGIKIKQVVSSIDDPMVFVEAYLAEKDIAKSFPEDVLKQAIQIPDFVDEKDINNRLDLRNELIVTIDGNDTKDFDDAINVKKIDENTYELGVHIADVSYYVKEDSPIDAEALKRGTSIYLVNKVIPMLPEKLSNGICSLNPNVDRFTLSAIMTIDKWGNNIKTELRQSVINSKYRLTYDRVNEFINNNKTFEDENLNNMLNNAVELAKIIRKFKNDQGYINFEIKEPYIKLDEKGNVVDIVEKSTGFSENLIEDFMVRANEQVAEYLAKAKLPALYRIHEKPSQEKLDYFVSVLNELNIKVAVNKDDITPKSFQKIVEQINKIRKDEFLKILFLRTMQKAIYSPDNIGHFGLASVDYCHFTSPIRRYPDLVIHRIIRELVFNKNKNKLDYFKQILPEIAVSNSNSEQVALETERNTNDLKYAEYWEKKIGQIHQGQVVSIMPFGIFVEFENKTEAMVHISNMCDNEYEVNEANTEFKSKNRTIKLGDMVSVVISKADRTTGKVDAILKECFDIQQTNKPLK